MSITSIASVLTTLMKKFDLNALDLEKHTGVPSSTIYRLLKNKDGNPTVEVLKKLSTFFQVTVSQLIGEEPVGVKQVPRIPAMAILKFLNASVEEKSTYQTIPIDFPLGSKSFATEVLDDLMEPFILMNSIVIIDPEKDISHKDFVLFIKKKNNLPQIRQVIKDGSEFYLKVLNTNFLLKAIKVMNADEFNFIGVIVHYRTNLFTLEKNRIENEITPLKQSI